MVWLGAARQHVGKMVTQYPPLRVSDTISTPACQYHNINPCVFVAQYQPLRVCGGSVNVMFAINLRHITFNSHDPSQNYSGPLPRHRRPGRLRTSGYGRKCLELLLEARPWPALEAASGECLVGRGGAGRGYHGADPQEFLNYCCHLYFYFSQFYCYCCWH